MTLPPYDCHVHSHLSGHSAAEMTPAAAARSARRAGLELIVALEHMPQVFVGEPPDEWYSRKGDRTHLNTLYSMAAEIEESGVDILPGAEADADPVKLDGSLMLGDLGGIAWTAFATHYYTDGRTFWTELVPMPEPLRQEALGKYTGWLRKAFERGGLSAWAHPGAMMARAFLLPDFSRDNVEPLEPVFALMSENGIAFELNELLADKLPTPYLFSYPELVRQAQAWGIRFVVGSDAHSPGRVGARKWVEQVAREAFLTDYDFVPLEEMKALSQRAAG